MIIFGLMHLKLGLSRSWSPHDSLCHTVLPHDVWTTTESSESARVMVTPDFGRGGGSILNFGISLHWTMMLTGFAGTPRDQRTKEKHNVIRIMDNTSLIAGENYGDCSLLFAQILQLHLRTGAVVGYCLLPSCIVSIALKYFLSCSSC